MSIEELCRAIHISKSGYYNWLGREIPETERDNIRIAEEIKVIHDEDNALGYRRIWEVLLRDKGIKVNAKRVLRICRFLGIKSFVKHNPHGCTKADNDPKHIEENILNREFTAESPNEKWLTDVTEFKYYVNGIKHKLYLSAILDLYDRRIVAYTIGDSNNNELVFSNFDIAVGRYPDAHPLFHSDRGFQYTGKAFHSKIESAGMIHSMSRVGKCLDNAPMEGFWGILKRERYYLHRYTSRQSLVDMITSYIEYYNERRYQRKLGILAPMEKYNLYYATAA